MTAPRTDFYTLIHKAYRRRLFAVAEQAGRTDWTDDRSVDALGTIFRDLLAELRAHAAHEERFAFPLLAAAVPGGAKALVVEHREEGEQMDDLEAHFARVRAADPDYEKRPALGLEFYRAFNRFVAHYLEHLDEEEEHAMPTMWELCMATELSQAMATFQASQAPEAALNSLALMLPALSLPERVALLASIQQGAPPHAVAAALDRATRVLPPDEWEAVQARLTASSARRSAHVPVDSSRR